MVKHISSEIHIWILLKCNLNTSSDHEAESDSLCCGTLQFLIPGKPN